MISDWKKTVALYAELYRQQYPHLHWTSADIRRMENEKIAQIRAECVRMQERCRYLLRKSGGFNEDEPRVPAGSPGAGEWTSDGGGSNRSTDTDSGMVMDDAGNLYPADSSIPKPDGIPDNWMTRPSLDNKGIRYTDPNNMGNEVRVMPGDPGSDFSVSQEPYVRWMNNGQWLDVNGNITTSKADAHIPLEDFEFIPEIFP